MQDTPNKDNSPKTTDIKWPEETDYKLYKPQKGKTSAGGHKSPTPRNKKSLPRGIIWGVFALVAIFCISLFLYIRGVSGRFSDSVVRNLDRFQSGVADLRNLETESAEKKFKAATEDINLSFGDFITKLRPIFGGATDLLKSFQVLTSKGVVLAKEIQFLEDNLFSFILDRRGEELTQRLETLEKTLGEVSLESSSFSSALKDFGSISPNIADFYLPLKFDLGRFDDFLGPLVGWLKSDNEHHILVMLENPSEIRPAGGFLGSYADVIIKKANLESINVHDINDADSELDIKIIPPKPLQAMTTRWKAADANWFFDFSDSATKVVEFLEASKIYQDKSIKFDGTIAISPQVIGDLLALTGPIKLAQKNIALDQKNFLVELQKEVQKSQRERATYPKRVLEELTPLLLSKLAALDVSQKQELFSLAQKWVEKKDLIFYFKEPSFENFFDYYNLSGKIYELPANFEGDYLAVVDANIDGGKSDLFIKQDVVLESQINHDGTLSNHLVIYRAHNGQKSEYWWYKVLNQDYLQIMVPPTAQLTNFSGGLKKNISPPVNYSKLGYTKDSLVEKIESSAEEIFSYPAVQSLSYAGKKVFATWSKIKAGEKTQIVFDYTKRLFLPPSEGQTYQFVFEKQAGTQRNYKFEISAPVGFRFRENNLPVYEYESDDPPGRLIVDLTLERI